MSTVVRDYVNKCKIICEGKDLQESIVDYTIPSISVELHNLAVSGTKTSMLNYLDLNEEEPILKSFDLGQTNLVTSLHYSSVLDILFVGTLSKKILLLSY